MYPFLRSKAYYVLYMKHAYTEMQSWSPGIRDGFARVFATEFAREADPGGAPVHGTVMGPRGRHESYCHWDAMWASN